MNKQTKNIAWYSGLFVTKLLFPIITIPIFTSLLSVEEFGIFALVIIVGTVITGISNFGLLGVFDREIFESYETEHKLFTVLLFVISLFTLLFIIFYFFEKKIIYFFFNRTLDSKVVLSAILFCGLKSFNQFFFTYLKNHENAKSYSMFSFLDSLFSAIIAYILIKTFGQGLLGYILGHALPSVLIFFIFYFKIFKLKIPKFLFGSLKKMLIISLPLTPRFFFGVINTQFDRYMLGILGSVGGVGLFEIGQKIGNIIFSFITALQNYFSPKVYQMFFSKEKKIISSIGPFLTPFFYLSVLFSLPLIIFSKEITILFLPEGYRDSWFVISILGLLYVVYFFGKIPQLMYAKKTKIISIISIISISLNICLNIPMIHYFGVKGAAAATFISGIITTFINFQLGQKYSPVVWGYRVFFYLSYLFLCFATIIILDFIDLNFKIELLFKSFLIIIYLFLSLDCYKFSVSKNPYHFNFIEIINKK